MNERIKELAEQAQQYAEYCTPQGLEWFPMFKEKFAELLIRECMDICERIELPFADKEDPHKIAWKQGCNDSADSIAHYFGVEE